MFRNDPLERNDGDYVKTCGQPWDIPCNRSTSSIVLLRWASRYLHVVACCTPSGTVFHAAMCVPKRGHERVFDRELENSFLFFSFVSLVLLVWTGNKTLTTAARRSYVIGGHDLLPSVTIWWRSRLVEQRLHIRFSFR